MPVGKKIKEFIFTQSVEPYFNIGDIVTIESTKLNRQTPNFDPNYYSYEVIRNTYIKKSNGDSYPLDFIWNVTGDTETKNYLKQLK